MFAPLLLLLLAVPLIEIYVLIQVGDAIGGPQTILLLIGMSLLGAWLLKREGSAAWRRLREAMARGQMPTNEAVDGAMILFGGALMLTPGFITDILGLLLILPTRNALKGPFRTLLGGWFLGRAGRIGSASRGVYAAKVVRSKTSKPRPVDRAAITQERPASPVVVPGDDEDGSLDKA